MRYITIILSLAVALSLTGCTTAEAVKSDNSSTSNLTAENENIVEGKVAKVNGNEIELNLGTIKSSQPKAPDDSKGSASGDGSSSGSDNAGTRGSGSRPEGAIGGTTGTTSPSGETPTGEVPSGAGSSGGASGSSGAGGGMNFGGATSIELSGESMTIEIPVGTPVYMTVRGASSKVDFTRLAKDNIVKVKMNDDNRVLSVTVVS